jgi:hypothetical protein
LTGNNNNDKINIEVNNTLLGTKKSYKLKRG